MEPNDLGTNFLLVLVNSNDSVSNTLASSYEVRAQSWVYSSVAECMPGMYKVLGSSLSIMQTQTKRQMDRQTDRQTHTHPIVITALFEGVTLSCGKIGTSYFLGYNLKSQCCNFLVLCYHGVYRIGHWELMVFFSTLSLCPSSVPHTWWDIGTHILVPVVLSP